MSNANALQDLAAVARQLVNDRELSVDDVVAINGSEENYKHSVEGHAATIAWHAMHQNFEAEMMRTVWHLGIAAYGMAREADQALPRLTRLGNQGDPALALARLRTR